VFENSLLSSDNFYSSLNKRIFEYLHQSYADDSIDINEIFTPDELGRITKMKIARMSLAENGPSVLAEYIELLAESMQKKAAGSVSTIDDLNKLITSKRK